ncbi:MAG: hypothetical protein E6Q67_15205 [Roseateles sp.]|nr:MAG: hypothetical protein E6Q67_15205 [Roseateles sp.]
MKRRELLALTASPLLLAACATPSTPPAPGDTARPGTGPLPAPPAAPAQPPGREWRAAWVATVANIDWPSRPGLSAEAQQAEIRALCETAQRTGLNALILQVRTSADALYESRLEPWSEYLTGVQGRAPGYDPLAVWLREARARGLELHAWLNPYRARHSTAKSPLAEGHVARTRPDWVKSYGDQLWIDPGEEAAAEHTLAVVRDLLSRYAVDGVHIDDYFYPYPVTATPNDPSNKVEIDFPDEPSWQRYQAGGGSLARADWRRYNVNRLVQRLHALVQEVRPGARLGISPFGLPKPAARPAGISGFSQYDKLYADVELWLREGWMDYLAPQLYWPRAQAGQAFEPLMRAWGAQNPRGLPIYPGLFTSRINDTPQSWAPEEITEQIALARRISAEWGQAGGHAHFSLVALAQNRKGIADALRLGPYAAPVAPR